MDNASQPANNATRQLFDLPPEMAALPRDHRGYPVPRFVAWPNGKPDFRVIDTKFWAECVNKKKCWLCGGGMGSRGWFVTGPMCCVTKTSSEPPSHRLCAEFATKNCPFLTKPMATRNERDLPDEIRDPGGIMIDRNPGVTAILETRSYRVFRDQNGQPLIEMGPPDSLTFWREGRIATREEVIVSIESGMPALIKAAEQDGREGLQALVDVVFEFRVKVLDRFLPQGVNGNGTAHP